MKRKLRHINHEEIARILNDRKAPLNTINEEMEKRQISVQELSEITEIDTSKIGPLLAGVRENPNVYYVAAICKCLEISLDELFFGPDTGDLGEDERVTKLRQELLAEKDKLIEKYKSDLAEVNEENKGLKKEGKGWKRFSLGLVIGVVVLVAISMNYLKMDMKNLDIGLIRDPLMVPLAITVSAIILCACVFAVVMFILMLRNEKKDRDRADDKKDRCD